MSTNLRSQISWHLW